MMRTFNRSFKTLFLSTLSSAVLVSFAHAQSDQGGLPLGDGTKLFPYANLSFGRDSNLFLTNTNQKSSNLQIYNPGVRLEAKGESAKFSLLYDITIGRYSQSSADNYTDQRIKGLGEFVFTEKVGLKLGVDYSRNHDQRGSTDRGIAGVPDEYRITNPNLFLSLGGKDAIGRVEVEAGSANRRYLNNRTTTLSSDRDSDNFAGRFFMRVAPKTAFLFEAREDRIDYKLGTSVQDSKERRYLAGLTWDVTDATSGSIKVGQIRKDFAAASRRDYSGTGWEANLSWKPLSYTKFDFFTIKTFAESTGLGDFTLSKKFGANWQHTWNSKVSSVVSLSRNDDDFVGNTRADSTDSFGLKLNYKLMRWLTIGGEYNNTSRDSNTSGFNYKKNAYMLTVGAAV